MRATKDQTAEGARTSGPHAASGWESERRAFERQKDRLMRRYRGEYVALRGGRVVDHDKADEVLVERMFKKFGDAPFYIARVESRPTVYEIPSPELTS